MKTKKTIKWYFTTYFRVFYIMWMLYFIMVLEARKTWYYPLQWIGGTIPFVLAFTTWLFVHPFILWVVDRNVLDVWIDMDDMGSEYPR